MELNLVYYGSVWIELIFAEIENWKHCSKIIFKYVNSVVGPVNSAWIVCEQCMNSAWTVFFVPCTVKSHDFTVHAQRKRKIGNVNAKCKRRIQCNPNGYYIKENMMCSRLGGWSQSNYMRVNFYHVKQLDMRWL